MRTSLTGPRRVAVAGNIVLAAVLAGYVAMSVAVFIADWPFGFLTLIPPGIAFLVWRFP